MSNGDLRHRLYALSAAQALDLPQAKALHRLAGLEAPETQPEQLDSWLPRGLAILGAALVGLGLVMWVAANWDDFGRMARFALLEAVVLLTGLAAGRTAWKAPMGLLALIGTGALLAYFGQTYQTGADAWQLFALWAGLSLPLVLAVRSDAVWAPWSLVAVLAVLFWVQTRTGHRWRVEPRDFASHLEGFGLLLFLCFALSRLFGQLTGAGIWTLRTVTSLSIVALLGMALWGLFGDRVGPQYGLGLATLILAGLWFMTRIAFDVFVLSAVALGLDVLLVAGLARLLFDGWSKHGDPIFELLLLGVTAAGLLAASVSLILRLSRRAQA